MSVSTPVIGFGIRPASVRAKHALRELYRRLSARQAAWASAAVAILATAPTVGRQPLSWDEATTLHAARLPWGQLGGLLAHTDAPMGLYYSTMHIWLAGWSSLGLGPNETLLRAPSTLAAVAGVVMLTRLVTGWLGPQTALLAGVLFAVHPMLTFYAQDARPYTLVTMTFLASTLVLRRAVDRPSWWLFIAYTLLVASTIFLHLFACYAIVGGAAVVGRRARRRVLAYWLAAVSTALLLASPLIFIAHRQVGAIGWIPAPSFRSVSTVLNHLLGGLGFVAALLGASVILLARRRESELPLFVVVWAVFPPVALVLADFVTPDLVARYGLVAVPAFAVVVAVAIRGDTRFSRPLAVLAVVSCLVASTVQQISPYKYEDYRAAADVVDDSARPGAAIVFLPTSMRDGYRPYVDADGVSVADPFLASSALQNDYPSLGGFEVDAAQADAGLHRAGQIFVFGYTLAQASHYLTSPMDIAKQRLLANYRVVRVAHFGGVAVSVLSRNR
ncbi:MAG: hypothetical protein JWM76_2416 [Pseudonocardiales bacterium]|nr:hypothetical protein [Pseudonocardiales bacterium]